MIFKQNSHSKLTSLISEHSTLTALPPAPRFFGSVPFPFPVPPTGAAAGGGHAMPPATELQRVVDEDDDGPRGAASSSTARGSGAVRGIWDWNKICAYHTNRVVRIQDANLGDLAQCLKHFERNDVEVPACLFSYLFGSSNALMCYDYCCVVSELWCSFLLPSQYSHVKHFTCFDLRIPLLGHCDHSGAIHPDCRFPHWGTAYVPRAWSWCSHHQVQRQLSYAGVGVGDWGRTNANELVILWFYWCIYIYSYSMWRIYIFILRYICILEMFLAQRHRYVTWSAGTKVGSESGWIFDEVVWDDRRPVLCIKKLLIEMESSVLQVGQKIFGSILEVRFDRMLQVCVVAC